MKRWVTKSFLKKKSTGGDSADVSLCQPMGTEEWHSVDLTDGTLLQCQMRKLPSLLFFLLLLSPPPPPFLPPPLSLSLHVLFSCKAYENFRKDVSWFNGPHTAAVADVSHVMSADDETTIWEVSRFFVFFCCCFCTKFCKGETTL